MQDSVMKKYEEWLHKADDAEVKSALEAMKGDETAIAEAFNKDLEFGTGGLCGNELPERLYDPQDHAGRCGLYENSRI